MRILCLSNYFPPFEQGGYEQWCSEIATALVERDHDVHVLTSRTRQVDETAITYVDGVAVHRRLHLEIEGGVAATGARLVFTRRAVERRNLNHLRALLDLVRPDVALIWGMWNVPRSVAASVERMLPGRVIYYFCDYWPALPSAYIQHWEAPPRRAWAGSAKRLLGRLALAHLHREKLDALRLDQPLCVSRAVKRVLLQANVRVEHARVLYGGTRMANGPATRTAADSVTRARSLRLLYAGRLVPTKGVHTAIRALSQLARDRPASLSIVGGGDAGYARELRNLARASGQLARVEFRGSATRHEMATIFGEHDVLVLPSDWEAFPRVMLEAMAAGLVVVGTTTGGTGELLVEGKTGLTFPYEDAGALARQLRRLCDDRDLWLRLARTGQECIQREFTFSRMADQFEMEVNAVAARRHA
jgi:glycogen(starch) synthase